MDARTVVEMEVGDRVERLATGFFFQQIARAQLFHRLAQCFRKLRVARPAGPRERGGERCFARIGAERPRKPGRIGGCEQRGVLSRLVEPFAESRQR